MGATGVAMELGDLQSADSADVIAWLRRHPAVCSKPRRASETFLSTGFEELDQLLGGGFPRSAMTELVGRRSSGRTAVVLRALEAASLRGEVVAWVDAADSLDPRYLVNAGVNVERFLWVRPSGHDWLKQALQASDLILRYINIKFIHFVAIFNGLKHKNDALGGFKVL